MNSISNEIKERVVEDLNTKYGNDLLNLEKCLEIKDRLLQEKAVILEQVLYLYASKHHNRISNFS